MERTAESIDAVGRIDDDPVVDEHVDHLLQFPLRGVLFVDLRKHQDKCTKNYLILRRFSSLLYA